MQTRQRKYCTLNVCILCFKKLRSLDTHEIVIPFFNQATPIICVINEMMIMPQRNSLSFRWMNNTNPWRSSVIHSMVATFSFQKRDLPKVHKHSYLHHVRVFLELIAIPSSGGHSSSIIFEVISSLLYCHCSHLYHHHYH